MFKEKAQSLAIKLDLKVLAKAKEKEAIMLTKVSPESDLSKITDNLYLSGEVKRNLIGKIASCSKSALLKEGITHIVNLVAHKVKNKFLDDFEYFNMTVHDQVGAELFQCFKTSA
jgi:hypothetical protein